MNATFILLIIATAFLFFGMRWLLSNTLFDMVKKSIPPVSNTERDAIDAGTLSYEQGIFAGKPDWQHLLNRDLSTLSDEEQDFMQGPVQEVMTHLQDYDVRKMANLPPKVWQLLKDKGFFSFIVPKAYGGLEFSAAAISRIVAAVGTKSFAGGVTIMVPNSLGPAKLLLKFGTQQQKDFYLPKLATGEYVPCFALTGITSGSDAAAMRDVGIVTRVKQGDTEEIVIRANFSKRYITLAPIATLIGLAIDVYDPDGLLGDDYPYANPTNKQVGITVALLEREHKGIEIGNRHMTSGVGFMNGPIRGRDVHIGFDQVIGGKEYLGKGWVMLMSCLGVGRAVSLPATSNAGMEFTTLYTLLYAGMRKQFNLPIAQMEGVIEKLSNSVYLHFINTATKNLANTLVDDGENPAVASAMVKYASTNDVRTCIDNCMDILAGKGICDGPHNKTQGTYQGIPIGITVEGANILTRTLITFAQGAIRAHPYLFSEIQALHDDDVPTARKKFRSLIIKHIGFTVCTAFCNLWHNSTRGAFLSLPTNTMAPKKYYGMVTVQAKQFAMLADGVLLLLGGRIKAKQILSGRCADILKNIYYAMAVLKHYETAKNPKLLPLLDYSLKRLAYENKNLMVAVIDNLPSPVVRGALRLVLFPLSKIVAGVGETAPMDKDAVALVRDLYKDDDLMQTLFQDVFDSQVLGDVYADYKMLQEADPIYQKLKPLLKSGKLVCGYHTDWRDVACENGHITSQERDILHQAEQVYYRQINVDEFSTDATIYQEGVDTDISNAR